MEICPFYYATHDTNNPVLMDFTNNSKKIIIIRIVIRTLDIRNHGLPRFKYKSKTEICH